MPIRLHVGPNFVKIHTTGINKSTECGEVDLGLLLDITSPTVAEISVNSRLSSVTRRNKLL